MATRSKIGVQQPDGTIHSIYCHWDGYPDGVGKTLLNYYNTPTAREQLIALGDLSSLGSKIGEKHPFDWRDGNMSAIEHEKLYGDWCLAFGRDRGETNTEAQVHNSIAEFSLCNSGEEWLYLWDATAEAWLCKPQGGRFTQLVGRLKKEKNIA